MPEYGSKKYWNSRYEVECKAFEWYLSWDDVKDVFAKLKKDFRVLDIGCGTSDMSEQLVKTYPSASVLAIDFCDLAIAHSKKASVSEKVEYRVQDILELEEKETFDLIIDKGTVDSMLCDEEGFKTVKKMMAVLEKVINPKGLCVVISYREPKYRTPLLKKGSQKNNWSVVHKKVRIDDIPLADRPNFNPEEHEDKGKDYYLYFLRR